MTNNNCIYQGANRPCYVHWKKAMFHCWFQESRVGADGNVLTDVKAVVEFESGTVVTVSPIAIQFADGGGFEGCTFIPQEDLKEMMKR